MDQIDMVKTMIENDKAVAESKQLQAVHVNQDVTDAFIESNTLKFQRAW
jgi:hypothetical protein